jgi:hypothetical protein
VALPSMDGRAWICGLLEVPDIWSLSKISKCYVKRSAGDVLSPAKARRRGLWLRIPWFAASAASYRGDLPGRRPDGPDVGDVGRVGGAGTTVFVWNEFCSRLRR